MSQHAMQQTAASLSSSRISNGIGGDLAGRPSTEIEIELKELNVALCRISDGLAIHYQRLAPVRVDVPTKDAMPNQPCPPEAQFSPIGAELRQLRKKAQDLAMAAEHLGDNLSI